MFHVKHYPRAKDSELRVQELGLALGSGGREHGLARNLSRIFTVGV